MSENLEELRIFEWPLAPAVGNAGIFAFEGIFGTSTSGAS